MTPLKFLHETKNVNKRKKERKNPYKVQNAKSDVLFLFFEFHQLLQPPKKVHNLLVILSFLVAY